MLLKASWGQELGARIQELVGRFAGDQDQKNSFESLERLPLMDQLIETECLNVVVPAGWLSS
jgi:hypothetical protein